MLSTVVLVCWHADIEWQRSWARAQQATVSVPQSKKSEAATAFSLMHGWSSW